MPLTSIDPASSPARPPLRGRRVVVMGLGQFGGGVGVAKFLVGRGAEVLITDTKPADKLGESVARLAGLPVQYRLGEHRTDDFVAADLIVVNPAVKPAGNAFLEAARAAGVPLTSEIRLLTQHLPGRARTIGITGSAGKSTTTAMVSHAMSHALAAQPERVRPRVHVGGNLGGSLLGSLDQIGPNDWVVLELSSFMLDGLREDRWSPHIAVITNLSPNHLDWHGSMDEYRRAKQAILDYQSEDDVAILGPGADGFARGAAKTVALSVADIARSADAIAPLRIPGEHNRINAAVAVEVCAAAGIDRNVAAASVASFTGLPHRLQLAAEHAGVRWFNDSKCTTPEAASLALSSFPAGLVHIILGGYDKGSDLRRLAALAKERSRAIYTIGATGDAIATAAEAATGPAQVNRCGTLDAAIDAIAARVSSGDVVLLSPACASWDQFTHFEARGEAFMRRVQQL